jgi:nicotinamide mononucleotide (NMN) deamidase PncC
MARRAREEFSSDIALALTGSLDPKSGVPEKITELCFDISGPKGERSGRARVRLTTLMDTRRRAVLDGMGELWRYLSAL